jgi:hypothetical protein
MDKYVLNVFKDHEVLKTLNKWSILITLGAFVLFYLFETLLTNTTGPALLGWSPLELFVSIVLIVLMIFIIITVHEAIHGLFFKLFRPGGNVKFGYSRGMFYATSPGEIFKRNQFKIIIIMPFIIITALMLILWFIIPHASFKYFLALHTGACAGDFYYLHLLNKHPHMQYVEDTDVGMTMYEDHPEG